MAFTTWTALRLAIKDAIADHVAGSPCTGSYSIGGKTLQYRSYRELLDLYQRTYEMESLENAGVKSSRVSFGSPRRFS